MSKTRLLLLLLSLCVSARLFANCTLTIPASVSAPAAATTRNIPVQASCSWEITQVPFWVHVASGTSGNGDGTIVLELQRNAASIGRSGDLVVNGQTIVIRQQGVNSVYPDYNDDGKTDLFWRHAGGSPGIVFTSFMNGTATSGGRWITQEADPIWNAYPAYSWIGGSPSDMYWVGGHGPTRATITKYVLDGYGVADRGNVNSDAVIAGFIHYVENGVNHTQELFAGSDTPGGPVILYTDPNNPPVHTQPAGWELAAIADVDGNLRSDYLFRHSTDGRCFVALVDNLPNQLLPTTGVFHSEPNLQWQIVATGDVDGDGRADLIWRNTADGRIWTMLMNGSTWTPGAVVWTEPDPHWVLKGTGDFNGDGRADLLFRNDVNGIVFVVLLDGNAVAGAAIAHYEPDLHWRLVGPATTRSMLAANSSSEP
jgi:peptidyl-Asp metalloendopeptidase